MNKADLIDNLAQKGDITGTQARKYVDLFLSEIQNALLSGDKVVISDFGAFSLSTRKAFTGRNPKSGESLTIPEVRIPVFKAGKGFKQALNTSV